MKIIPKLFINLTLSIPLIYLTVKSIIFHQKIKKHQKLTGKKWLFEDFTYNGMVGFNFINIFNIIINLFNISYKQFAWTLQAELLFSIISVLLIVFIYVSADILPKRFVEILAKEHPEYQLV